MTTFYTRKDWTRIVRTIRKQGWKMTKAERAELVKLVKNLGEDITRRMFPHRFDRGYRRVYGFGDKPCPLFVTYGAAESYNVSWQNGVCWLTYNGLKVE